MSKQLVTRLSPVFFSENVPPKSKGRREYILTGNGSVRKVNITFVTGENGTLHVRPFVVLPGGIQQELVNYGGDNRFVNGDSSKFEADCFQPIENQTKLCVDFENVGDAESKLIVDIIVEYVQVEEISTVIKGYYGV